MKRTILWVIIIIIIVLGLLLGFNSDQDTEVSDETIKVGAALGLTGAASVDALNIKRGLELAKEDLEKDGIKVEIFYEDDATDPKQTVSALRKLLAKDLDFVIGPTWSFLADAGASIIDDEKIVAFMPANTSEFVNSDTKYYFFGATKNTLKREPIANWLRENDKKRAAIIVDTGSWSDSHIGPFSDAVADVGGEVVLTERIPFGTGVDTIPTVLAKVQAEDADVILWTGYENDAIVLTKKKQDQQIDTPVIAATETFRKVKREGKLSITEKDQIYITGVKFSEEFADKFRERYGEEPGTYSDSAYDGLMLLTKAVQEKSSEEDLADFLRDGYSYSGFANEYSFDQNGDIIGGEWIIKHLK